MIPPSIRSRERQFLAAVGILALFLSGNPVRADETLETSWKDYQAYGLPVPPADTELGYLPAPAVTISNGVRHHDTYLVLRTMKTDHKGRTIFWIGCEPRPNWASIEIQPIDPTKAILKNTVRMPSHGYADANPKFPTCPDLALAIQCHARGWDDLANALLDRSSRNEKADPFNLPKPRPRDDRVALAELAWNYYCNRFAREAGDRMPIVEHLKQLLSTHYVDTNANRNTVADMEKTLTPVKATAGSPEAASVARNRKMSVASADFAGLRPPKAVGITYSSIVGEARPPAIISSAFPKPTQTCRHCLTQEACHLSKRPAC